MKITSMKKGVLISITILILSSCGVGRQNEDVVVEGKFTMKIPLNMSIASDLNDDAALQYQNLFNELYVIVIDEDITEFETLIEENDLKEDYGFDLDGYFNLVINGCVMELENVKKSEVIDIRINGLSAKQIGIEGEIEGIDIYYCYTAIKGKNTYYQIVSWTILENKAQHEKLLRKMALSFNEI